MKIRYFSDLHLEFIKPNKINEFIARIPSGLDEVCVCAGDIGNPLNSNYDIFINYLSKNFKKTFIITGNHEYYQKEKSIEEIDSFLTEYFKKYNNISFLNNKCECYENYCFIGTTLWSQITDNDYKINDVYNIPNFDYIQYNKLNKINTDFLENTLKNNNNCIIITHHIPSLSLIHNKYKTITMMPYNQWFYCNLDEFIETNKDKIKCWIYGHTHMEGFNKIHNIPFICNPIGYPNENSIIDFQKIFNI